MPQFCRVAEFMSEDAVLNKVRFRGKEGILPDGTTLYGSPLLRVLHADKVEALLAQGKGGGDDAAG